MKLTGRDDDVITQVWFFNKTRWFVSTVSHSGCDGRKSGWMLAVLRKTFTAAPHIVNKHH